MDVLLYDEKMKKKGGLQQSPLLSLCLHGYSEVFVCNRGGKPAPWCTAEKPFLDQSISTTQKT